MRGSLAATLSIAALLPLRRRPGLVASAGAGAAVAGATLELPVAGAVTGILASLTVARSRPSLAAAAAGAAGGVAVALATRKVWPVAPRTPAEVRRSHTARSSPASPDGAGVTIVLNESAGRSGDDGIADRIHRELPMARVVTVDDATSLDDALAAAASGAEVIGIVGGDGSINAAAGVAHAAGKPLLVIPGGTLNHFARDVGITGVDDAIEAVRDGEAVAVDVSAIDGKPFLNTASFGVYSDLVDVRERLEPTIGKWPALVLALARVLCNGEPVSVELDGTPRTLWMVFVGNCRYEPPGFAPAWRERLDDGVLDVRVVDATRPFARLSLVAAVLTGRLRQCRVYEEFATRECRITDLSAPRLARDGETFDGAPDFVIEKRPEPLSVYALRRPSAPDSRRSHRPMATRRPSATTPPTAVSHAPACS